MAISLVNYYNQESSSQVCSGVNVIEAIPLWCARGLSPMWLWILWSWQSLLIISWGFPKALGSQAWLGRWGCSKTFSCAVESSQLNTKDRAQGSPRLARCEDRTMRQIAKEFPCMISHLFGLFVCLSEVRHEWTHTYPGVWEIRIR